MDSVLIFGGELLIAAIAGGVGFMLGTQHVSRHVVRVAQNVTDWLTLRDCILELSIRESLSAGEKAS